MKKFEYKTIKVDTGCGAEELDERFDSLGEKGWELVTAAADDSMDDNGDTYTEFIWYTFKREIE